MKKSLIKDMKVKSKITLFSVMMLVLIIIISGVGIWSSNMVNKARKSQYENYGMGQYYMMEAFSNFSNIQTKVRNILFVYYNDPTALQEQEASITTYRANARKYLDLFEEVLPNLPAEVATAYQPIEDDISSWIETVDTYLEMAKSGQQEAAIVDLLENGKYIANQVEEDMRELIQLLDSQSDAQDAKLSQHPAAIRIDGYTDRSSDRRYYHYPRVLHIADQVDYPPDGEAV